METKGLCSYIGYTCALRYMGTPLGPKYIPYTYMDPLGLMGVVLKVLVRRGHSMTILGTGIFSTTTIMRGCQDYGPCLGPSIPRLQIPNKAPSAYDPLLWPSAP